MLSLFDFFFFFKQKTAYEMRISDWSSDVCSSDLASIVSHPTCVDPFAPAWPSCRQIFASDCMWTKLVTRRHAATCSGAYMPVHPNVIRASAATHVISVQTSPAPPCARAPQWTRGKSFGVPSLAEYVTIWVTTTRLARARSHRQYTAHHGRAGARVVG